MGFRGPVVKTLAETTRDPGFESRRIPDFFHLSKGTKTISMDEWMDGTDGWADGRVDGRTSRWVDGRMDEHILNDFN